MSTQMENSFSQYIDTPFESNILPAAPPNAVIHPNSKISADQLGKIPMKWTADGWVGFKGWSEFEPTPQHLRLWDTWPDCNVSLQMRGLVGIDVDCEDEAFVSKVRNAIELYLGSSYTTRSRAGSNRIIFILKGSLAKRVLKYLNERTGELIGIDVLGEGSQCIIDGIHPSGAPYSNNIDEVSYDDLPVIDDDLCNQLIDDITRRVMPLGWIKQSSSTSTSVNDADIDVQEYEASEQDIKVDLLRALGLDIRNLIKEGVEQGKRSEALASVITRLIKIDLSDSQIANILMNPEHGIGSKCREQGIEWTMKDIARIRARFRQVEEGDGESSQQPDTDTAQKPNDSEQWVAEDPEQVLRQEIKELEGSCTSSDVESILEKIAKLDNPILSDLLLKELKKASKVSISSLRDMLSKLSGDAAADVLTHNQLAAKYISSLVENDIRTVWAEETVFEPNSDRLWEAKDESSVYSGLLALLDGQPNCTRNSDYKAIHQCYTRQIDDPRFFLDAPEGLAMDDGYFYRVDGKSLVVEPLEYSHRATWRATCAPDVDVPTPEWNKFLHQIFEGEDIDGQIRQLQQVICMLLLGLLPQKQYGILFYGEPATGKSVLLEVLAAMFPREQVTSIPPHMWDNEYYLAMMAHSRLNIVGELSEEKAIESESIKKVMDRLPITARHPAGKPFQFMPLAAQIFALNEFPYLRDKTEAIARRFLMFHFKNKIAEGDRDEHLAKRLKRELPGIVNWAFEAAPIVLGREFKPSQTTLNMRDIWLNKTNNVVEFLTDNLVIEYCEHSVTPLATVHSIYKDWCKMCGYRAYGRNNFMTLLRRIKETKRVFHREHNPSGGECLVGYKLHDKATEYVGSVTFGLKPSFTTIKSVNGNGE